MKFKFRLGEIENEGKLTYLPEEYGFSFFPTSRDKITSIAIGTLQISISKEGKLIDVWGYHPHTCWTRESLNLPSVSKGSVFAEIEDITPGVSEKLVEEEEWETFCDDDASWLCIGALDVDHSVDFIEFAPGCIVGIRSGYLQSIWLHFLVDKTIFHE